MNEGPDPIRIHAKRNENMSTRKNTWRAALGLAILLLASACASRGTSQDTYMGGEGAETEKIGGTTSISNELEITNLREKRLDDSRLHVQFELHNMRGGNLAFEWTVEWFDAAGFRIDWPQHWTPTAIGGKGYEILSLTGPTPNTSNWRLAVRKPNSVK